MALSCESPRLAQASTLPYGVPTFLDAADCAAAIQPAPRHALSLVGFEHSPSARSLQPGKNLNPRAGLSDAPLSSGECERLFSGLFVASHSAYDSVGEVAFVGSSGFSSGFAFCGFAGEVGGCLRLLAGLGDRGDVQH